jgi:tripartite-type tricarboxylate transporter receptor subunit TctC
MKGRVFLSILGALIMALMISAPAAPATDYPVKPITMQVPWPAGGSTDVGARILASIAEKKIGQPIVVINKAGAGSQVGLTELARQKPDGYYIGFVSLPALNTIILDPERKAVFTIDDFIPIINQVLDPGIIAVKADSPYKTFKDLIDDAKKRPGTITAGTTGILGDDHLAILMVEEAAGVKLRIVHFEGGAPQMAALLGGQIDLGFDNVGSYGPRIKAGDTRGLAVMDRERSKFVPDVPTTVDLGYPTVISSSTRGVMGPKGIPVPIIKKIQDSFMQAMKDPEHVEKMDKACLAVRPMVGDEYAKYFRDLHERCKPLVEAARKAR